MRDKILFLSCFGFVAGVLLASFFIPDFFAVVFVSMLSLLTLLFFSVSKNKWGIIAACSIFAFTLGILRFTLADMNEPLFSGFPETATGLIVEDPDKRENNQKLTTLVETEEFTTKVLITVGFEDNYKYGDTIKFSGDWEKPENFTTDQGKVFDYVNYLRKDGIFYLISYPEIEIIDTGGGNFIKRGLFALKNFFLDKINFAIPEPESLLLGGLILGERGAFDDTLRQALVDTGTIHIVALSGYNVTIVAEWITRFFSLFMAGTWAFGAGIFGIILFVIMAGAGSTAVRAGTMASLALVARATGRTYDVARALVLAGVTMMLINPFVLVFDVSFQLSFIATVAVIFFAPKVEKYFKWVPEKWKLRDVISVTFAAYIFVLPFILYKMGNLSLVALPANVLILPFIPLTMMFGFFTSLTGAIWYALAVPFGWISYALLHYELMVVEFFARLPVASFAIPNFPLWLTLLIYACFLYKLFGLHIKEFISSPL